ncbi:hypothetical protein EVAR_93389_1 [Eumeta japonica]|uniref:Uncharacterized protein n=1 Tax=Eumeta variegata TaxID=151549 RepID=A0A4C1UR37_EUMVA|nr:hypothetical protein EVAR_93389_1 [Eumeta japonica]
MTLVSAGGSGHPVICGDGLCATPYQRPFPYSIALPPSTVRISSRMPDSCLRGSFPGFVATIALPGRCLSVAVDIPSGPGVLFLGKRSTILCSSAGDIKKSPGRGWWGGHVFTHSLLYV